jgi:hypothetical protein
MLVFVLSCDTARTHRFPEQVFDTLISVLGGAHGPMDTSVTLAEIDIVCSSTNCPPGDRLGEPIRNEPRSPCYFHAVAGNGKEPRDWEKAQFSSTPGDGPFMEFFFDELQDLVNTSAIFEQGLQELVDAIMVMVTEGFLPAYEDLRAIRAY